MDSTPLLPLPTCGANNAVVQTGATASQPGLLPVARSWIAKFRI
jgi:hypothetical protein